MDIFCLPSLSPIGVLIVSILYLSVNQARCCAAKHGFRGVRDTFDTTLRYDLAAREGRRGNEGNGRWGGWGEGPRARLLKDQGSNGSISGGGFDKRRKSPTRGGDV